MKKFLFSIFFLAFCSLGAIAQTMPTISTDGNDVWYYVQMKNGGGVLQDTGDNTNILTKSPVQSQDNQLWKITGTADGYTLTCKTGRKLNFASSRFQASSTGSVTFKLKATTNGSYMPAWELQRIGAAADKPSLNQFGGAGLEKELGEWKFADANNPLQFLLPSEIAFYPYKPNKPTPEATLSGTASAPAVKYSLWYRTPATDWMTQALPIGNGQFGGMIFGGVKQDEIQFNDKTLWEGSTKSYGAYQNFGSVFINTLSDNTAASNYIRTLDIENSLATVEYDANGTHYKREYFSSYPDSALVIRLTASQAAKLNNEIFLYLDHPCLMTYENNFISGKGKLSLVSYFARMEVKNEGGTIEKTANSIKVTNADAITIVLRGKTDYAPSSPTYISAANNTQAEVESIVSKAIAQDYNVLKAKHIADYKSLFDRVTLSLGTTSNTTPTNQLITAYAAKPDNFLNELYFQFGRYLMISSARGLALPSNLQGIWNNSNKPPWSADIHSNINVQENYWLAEVTNLSELHRTFLDYIYTEAMVHPQWKQNAKDAGQTKGWTLYTENNIFGWHGGFMHNYVIANAWYAMHIWQHYRYTLDKDYLLNKAYPVMKTCAEFWMERLIADKGNTTYGFAPDGTLVCPKEYSPEHGPGAEDGVAHAQQLVWDLFKNTLEAMDSLGAAVAGDAAFKASLQAKFAKLDDGLHTELDGGKIFLREWKYTPRTAIGDYAHRHISHLVGLYPGNQISPLINDSIFKAAVVALDSRGDFSTGWAMGHRITCWARTLDGNRAYRILNNALQLSSGGGGGIYTNLFDAHPPFQIDGNFAATAAIAELLIQSHINNTLQLLPALPDAWADGEVKGLKAIGNFQIDMKWEKGTLTNALIVSNKGLECKVNFPYAKIATVKNKLTGEKVSFTAVDKNTISFSTNENGQYEITAGPVCEAPAFSLAEGKYSEEQTLEITCPTEGAVIRYTFDGTEPAEDSPVYSAPLLITKSVLVKAVAMKDGMADSKVVSAGYILGDYTVNTLPGALQSRTDRYLDKLMFTGNSGGKLTAALPTISPRYLYNNLTDSVAATGYAVPGETLTPTMTYTGTWMHGFVFLDFENDGLFNESLNADGTPATGSDVVSYSYYNGKNSAGATPANQNPGVNSPAFTVPAGMTPGFYRMRYKVDWDNIDAGGNAGTTNNIINNGGGIADVLLNVHKATSHVTIVGTNGEVLKADNTALTGTDVPFGGAIEIVLKPSETYTQNGMTIKHGYLTNPEFIHSNRQWRLETILADQIVDNRFTIPAKYVDGDVEIAVNFIKSSGIGNIYTDPNLQIKTDKNMLSIKTLKPVNVKISDITGRVIFSGTFPGERVFRLKSGVYIVNNQKVVVK